MFICALTVSAATSWEFTHSVSMGGKKEYTDLSASNNYANIQMVIDGMTYGTKTTTVFKTYLKTSSSTTLKTTKTYSITKNSTVLKGLGYVGKGTWNIRNEAFTSSASYVGWNGTLTIYSATSSL